MCPRGPMRDVVALGAEAVAAAEIFATRTARRMRVVGNPSEVWRGERPDVLVATTKAAGHDLLAKLVPRDPEMSATGLLLAPDRDRLIEQAQLRATETARRSSPFHIEVRNDLEHGREVGPEGAVLLGRSTEPAEIREALNSGAGLLSLTTHADGIDAMLPGGVLCPFDQLPASMDEARLPICIRADYCHRLKRDFGSAQQDPELVRPDELAADILLLNVCWGFLAEPALVDPRLTLMHRLLRNPRVGAVVAPWEIITTSSHEIAPLTAMLRGGTRLGLAVSRFVNQMRRRRNPIPLCVFGDPDLRLTPPPRDKGAPPASREVPTFLAMYLKAVQSILEDHQISLHETAAEGVVKYYEAIEGPGAAGTEPGLEATMRSSVLDFLVSRGGAISRNWESFGLRPVFEDEEVPCDICEAPAKEAEVALKAPTLQPRRIRRCPRCGCFEDAPASAPHRALIYYPGHVVLKGELPTPPVAARLMFETPDMSGNVSWSWPLEDGALRPVFEFSARPTRQHSHATLLFIDRLGLSALRTPIDPAGPWN